MNGRPTTEPPVASLRHSPAASGPFDELRARGAAHWLEPPAAEATAEAAAGRRPGGAAGSRDGPELVEVRAPAGGLPSPDDPLVLRFDEPVVAGRGAIRFRGDVGTIKIRARDAEQVQIDGAEVRIEPRREFDPGASYRLELGPRSLRDLDGNRLGALDPELLPRLAAGGDAGDGGAEPRASWTILVYMAADNDLEPWALADLAEMERVALPGSVNLAALVDRSPWYVAGPRDFTDTRRGPVAPDGDPARVGAGLVPIGERDTGDPETLTEFLDWAHTTFPAERYGLVVWDHGGGLEGVAFDGSSRGDRLTLAETREAIAASHLGRVDLLGFDACLMAMVEVASELAGVARVMVASQELEPVEGWAYDRWLGALARDPEAGPAELAERIVETYAERFAGRRDITLSAVDLEEVAGLETALDGLAREVATSVDPGDLRALAAAAAAARPTPRDASYPYRDLGDFLDGIQERVTDPAITTAARRAEAALASLVLAEAGTVERASGLSIHLPGAGDAPWPDYGPSDYAFLERVGWDGLVDRLVAVG